MNGRFQHPITYDDSIGSLDRTRIHDLYRSGESTPADVVEAIYGRIAARGDDGVWITLVPESDAAAVAASLPGGLDDPATPLWGLPYALKDNIDVRGLPTTAAFPGWHRAVDRSADVVLRLAAAGAILIGKTNLDQFATGLNGTRTPYTIPRNTFDETLVPGGSSSGSGVAVAAGLVSFSIGTDTAGSGRVPAALNNVVGIKPSRGLVSTTGLVPACRSLDCISVFSLTVDDGSRVLSAISGWDDRDPWSRRFGEHPESLLQPTPALPPLSSVVFAVPRADDVDFEGDSAAAAAWSSELQRLAEAGTSFVELDMRPLFEVGQSLYSGAWVAERRAGLEHVIETTPDALLPITRRILDVGLDITAARVFADQDRAQGVGSRLAPLFERVDALLTPTVTATFTVAEMLADPIARNSRLGRFTTYTNILDLAAVALPAGLDASGRPFGITLTAQAGSDARLSRLAQAVETLHPGSLGATPYSALEGARASETLVGTHASTIGSVAHTPTVDLAVVGAHLSGMPLNEQLQQLDARLLFATHTAARYRLHALPNTAPPKPGLRRVPEGGVPIAVEVYRLSVLAFGRFVDLVPAPLAIGTIELDDGSFVKGFVCEPAAFEGAPDISEFGGWRNYCAALR